MTDQVQLAVAGPDRTSRDARELERLMMRQRIPVQRADAGMAPGHMGGAEILITTISAAVSVVDIVMCARDLLRHLRPSPRSVHVEIDYKNNTVTLDADWASREPADLVPVLEALGIPR